MIDWSLAKAGAVAVHRNGGRSVIGDYSCGLVHTLTLGGDNFIYLDSGVIKVYRDSPFDIIAVEAAPEPVQVKLYWAEGYPTALGCPFKGCTHEIIITMQHNSYNHPDCDSIKMEKL